MKIKYIYQLKYEKKALEQVYNIVNIGLPAKKDLS